jgi:L-amino acid N-acyltransferase YncA
MSVEIREAGPEDAAAIQAIHTPVVAGTAISFEEVPPTIEKSAVEPPPWGNRRLSPYRQRNGEILSSARLA